MRRLRVALICPSDNALTETFIQAHTERLDADIVNYFGGTFPAFTGNGERWLADGVLAKAGNMLERFRTGLSDRQFAERKLAERLQRENIDVVLAEYGLTGASMLETCRLAELPLVVHFHGYDASQKEVLERYAEGYKRLFTEAAQIVAVSTEMKRALENLGAPSDQITLNPYGVDIHRFDPIGNRQKGQFLAVGRFVEKKAAPMTLMAFRHVWVKHPECHLVMIGDGPQLQLSRDLASAFGMNNAIEFRGAQPHHEVARAMQEASVFIQHSVRAHTGDMEGTPNSVLEACASGLPVVATRHAGIPDVVVEGETGWLVEEGDVLGMGKAMERLVREPDLAVQAGRAGRKRIEKHFSMDKSLRKLLDVLENAVQTGQTPVQEPQ